MVWSATVTRGRLGGLGLVWLGLVPLRCASFCVRFLDFFFVSFIFAVVSFLVVLFRFVSFHSQEYEKLKADARAQGSGQREEAAALERQLASARSQLDQLGSNKVRELAVRDAAPPTANSIGSAL